MASSHFCCYKPILSEILVWLIIVANLGYFKNISLIQLVYSFQSVNENEENIDFFTLTVDEYLRVYCCSTICTPSLVVEEMLLASRFDIFWCHRFWTCNKIHRRKLIYLVCVISILWLLFKCWFFPAGNHCWL